MFDVITVGSATVDAFVNTGSKLFKKSMLKSYVKVPFGTKIVVDELRFDIGGGGTNTAVALSRLGLRTSYIGSIGRGVNSKRVLDLLEKEKVDTGFVQNENGRTGYSIILDASEHDRTILTFKGNNNNLDYSKIDKDKLKTKWFYFAAMLEKSFDAQKKLAEYAHKNKIKICYNPSSYIAEKGVKYIKEILDKTDLLILNKEEAGYLVGNKKIKNMLVKLHKLGPKLVVVTDGKCGAFAIEGGKIYSVKPKKVNVLETTGAGDSFASTFLAGIIKKSEIEFALKMALVNSTSVITHYGAKNKLLSYKEILSKIHDIDVRIETL